MVKEVGQRVDAGNVKTIIMPDKKFEEHMMYDAKKAESPKEHLSLKNKGYGHSPNKMRSSPLPGMMSSNGRTSPLNCWSGYERVSGTKEFSDGSCKKK